MNIYVNYGKYSMEIGADSDITAFRVCNEYDSVLAYGTFTLGITWQDEDACLPSWIDDIVQCLARFSNRKHLFVEQVVHDILACDCLYDAGFHVSIDL